ncbi:hypothetical protein [Bacillus kexueae]|uniref:hypothetical protein n=1 Tax=Aeribacillus kexueae TaxID=2078952 RepID=UPI001FAEC422|nr:hypothetical protein [Bacillus kexueae]
MMLTNDDFQRITKAITYAYEQLSVQMSDENLIHLIEAQQNVRHAMGLALSDDSMRFTSLLNIENK